MITTNQIVIVFSLLEIAIRFFFVLNLESLGFYVGNFVPTIFSQAHSLSIWLGNLKSNGGPLSNYPKPKLLKPSKIGLKPKSPKQKGLQPQNPRYLFGPSPCLAQLQKKTFPSNSAYRAYLKGLQAQAAETLSQLAGSDSEDEEDTASSSAFLQ